MGGDGSAGDHTVPHAISLTPHWPFPKVQILSDLPSHHLLSTAGRAWGDYSSSTFRQHFLPCLEVQTDFLMSSSMYIFLLPHFLPLLYPGLCKTGRTLAEAEQLDFLSFPHSLPFFFLILSQKPRSFKDVHVSLALP